ncbi:inactive peptidyl-prolyl cis-trans isomerase FKBP6 isoform X2 [Halyomorpha halys]|uniref:inactive peptidyl-prolyl cis-trans isomerase FKBP6 isoform X2 n=1 Tax=Halyomorpha halys TaxID=286706 RepID=UPI0034D29EBF
MEDFCANTRIKDGVLREILEKSASEFTLDAGDTLIDETEEDRIDKVYKFDDFAPFINLDCIGCGDTEDVSTQTPFEKIKQKMTNVTEDGKVSKLILRFGNGNVVPPKSVVYFHYNSYLEMEEIPFDSSYLRNEKPLRMQLGHGDLYLGFEKSLLTMREGEKSQFLVHSDYAFGKLGAPPRITPNATILLEIELIKIVDCSGIDKSEEISGENDSFSEIYSKAEGYQILGNDFFGQGNISAAIDKYKKAEKVLLTSKPNDAEETQYTELLLKLYINLCVCYNHPKIKAHEKVCHAAKAAFYSCTEGAGKSAKLFFNLGKAFIELNEFDKANKNLKKALSLEPQNKNTNDLLARLQIKGHYAMKV